MKRIYLDAGQARRVLPRPRRDRLRPGGRAGRRDVHARALRRRARRADLPLPGRDPRAGDRARAVAPDGHLRYGTRVTARSLDITALTCPMTWVRTKLELERMAPGEALEVRCRPGEALENVPRSAREAGHGVSVEGTTIRIVRAHELQPAQLLPRPRRRGRLGQGRRRAARRPSRWCPTLTDAEIERYARQLVLPEWGAAAQLALAEASVLVIGAGALGSPVAMYLAGAGVGRLGIVDDDAVELSNLHRQLLHFTPDVGVPKAESAAAKLRFLNPDVVVEPYQTRVDAANAAAVVEGQDLVVDCSDAFATRYAVNAACCAAGVPLVEAGVLGMSGLVMSVKPGRTACYRCAFPHRAGRRAALRRRRRARARGGRARLAPGAGGDEAADRRRPGADERLPPGRSRDDGLPPRPRDAARRLPRLRRGLASRAWPDSGTSWGRCGATSPRRTTAIPPRAACRRSRSSSPGRACRRCSRTGWPTRWTRRACRSRRACSRSSRGRSRTSRSTRARRSATGCSSTTAPAW